MCCPSWLPPMMRLDGDWERQILVNLYRVFTNDFKVNVCYFNHLRVIYDTHKKESNLEEGFWHLITRDDKTLGGRITDFPRAERLPWCKPTIEHATNDVEILTWDYRESSKRINSYIWLINYDYVVIVQKRKKVAFLLTAYHVDGNSTKKSLRRKYSQRI